MDNAFVESIDKLKQDTLNLIKLFSSLQLSAAGKLTYQSTLPSFLTRKLYGVLTDVQNTKNVAPMAEVMAPQPIQ